MNEQMNNMDQDKAIETNASNVSANEAANTPAAGDETTNVLPLDDGFAADSVNGSDATGASDSDVFSSTSIPDATTVIDSGATGNNAAYDTYYQEPAPAKRRNLVAPIAAAAGAVAIAAAFVAGGAFSKASSPSVLTPQNDGQTSESTVYDKTAPTTNTDEQTTADQDDKNDSSSVNTNDKSGSGNTGTSETDSKTTEKDEDGNITAVTCEYDP
ncbi:MAG: hypothetical protein Q4C09_08970, partial [Atopobiaceae bacterium]|nr:hypothetical protein [Atopobiaceae bacterium]